MQAIWNTKTKGVETFLSSEIFRELLCEILKDKERKAETVSNSDYDTPSWPYKQAHRNGYNECLKDILTLLRD